MYECMYICICIRIYVYICTRMCVSMYVYLNCLTTNSVTVNVSICHSDGQSVQCMSVSTPFGAHDPPLFMPLAREPDFLYHVPTCY